VQMDLEVGTRDGACALGQLGPAPKTLLSCMISVARLTSRGSKQRGIRVSNFLIGTSSVPNTYNILAGGDAQSM
jgi:hypothetical protein